MLTSTPKLLPPTRSYSQRYTLYLNSIDIALNILIWAKNHPRTPYHKYLSLTSPFFFSRRCPIQPSWILLLFLTTSFYHVDHLLSVLREKPCSHHFPFKDLIARTNSYSLQVKKRIKTNYNILCSILIFLPSQKGDLRFNC